MKPFGKRATKNSFIMSRKRCGTLKSKTYFGSHSQTFHLYFVSSTCIEFCLTFALPPVLNGYDFTGSSVLYSA